MAFVSGREPFATSGDGYPPDWDQRRQRTYRRDDYTCQNCGTTGGPKGDAELHAHHIVPKSRGGTHKVSNLTTLCYDCHNRAHDHHVPRGDSDESGSDEDDSASDDVNDDDDEWIPGPIYLENQYLDGEINFGEFESRIEESLLEHGAPSAEARDIAQSKREDSSSARDQNQSGKDEENELRPIHLAAILVFVGLFLYPPTAIRMIQGLALLLIITFILYVGLWMVAITGAVFKTFNIIPDSN